MNESQTLELQVKTQAEQAKSSLDTLTKSLSKIENSLNNIYLKLGKIEGKSQSSITNVTNEVNKLSTVADKTSNNVSKMSKALSLGGLYLGAKKLTTSFLDWMDLAIDYTEQLNLFNVVFKNVEKNGTTTFSKLGQEATKYQNKLNEAFGTNKTETLYAQAIFQSMGESAGIKDTYASIMSEAMTNLTYDLASLFNSNEKDVAEALRAGVYAGQTKPLRKYGIDVTQNTMKPLLESLGITDRTVSELSYAEKEILRYIATLKQSQVAMGDMANTIESPSNQLKVFRQQLAEAKVALQSLFIGGFSKILPYANALLMVVKEVSKAIATLFGIKLTDYNSGIASSGYDDYLDDIGENADNASGKVKELKRQVLGFDQINNLSENKNNGGSGTAISGGIDQRLLDAIKGYDNGLDKVKMKATEIRDRIMEWLGLTKEIDPLTGEIKWKFSDTNSTLYKIVDAFKDIIKYGKDAIKKVFKIIINDFKNGWFGDTVVIILEGIGKALKFISENRVAQEILAKILETLIGIKMLNLIPGMDNLLSPLKKIKDAFSKARKEGDSFGDSLKKGFSSDNLNKIDRLKIAVDGFLTAGLGLKTVGEAFKDISDNGANLSNTLEASIGSLETIAGGALIGSAFGPIGALIGGLAGAVGDLIVAINNYDDAGEKMKKKSEEIFKTAEKNLEDYYKAKQSLEDTMNENLSVHTHNETLLTELENMIDANGRLKEGYEDRANFILNELNNAYGTEYELLDLEQGKYGEIKQAIYELIDIKKSEIMLEAEKENYVNALKNEKQAYYDYVDSVKQYNDTNEKALDILDKKNEMEKIAGTQAYKNYKYVSDLTGKTYEGAYAYEQIKKDLESYDDTLKNNESTMQKNRELWVNYKEDIIYYEDLQTAVLKDDVEKQKQIIEDRTNAIINADRDEKITLSDKIRYAQDSYDTLLRIYEDNGKEITDEVRNQAQTQLEEVSKGLLNQTNEVKDGKYSNDLLEAWYTLGKVSEEKFIEKFNQLPDDVQKNVVDQMYEKGYSISDELQKGINQKQPTIKIDADTSSATKKINSLSGLIQNFTSTASTVINSVFKNNAQGGVFKNGTWKNIPQYANGGVPSHGSLFVAGERGAEIVGHLNGRTEVLNQSQLASVMYSAITSAMSKFNAGSQIDVFVHSDEGVIVDRINQKTKQTGVCPINIPY